MDCSGIKGFNYQPSYGRNGLELIKHMQALRPEMYTRWSLFRSARS